MNARTPKDDPRCNELFREHVTSAAFVLNLGKTHITALVRLDLELKYEVLLEYRELRTLSRAHQLDVPALQGLLGRGLVRHTWREDIYGPGAPRHEEWVQGVMNRTWKRGNDWSITRAGRLVCELLTEAGIYQEYAGPLLPMVEAERGRRRAS